ncbi:MAG: cupin domain-containing protein [Bacteroidota bacterium]|nr:cupin domain-containing protein [Bacteroidota bacterium]
MKPVKSSKSFLNTSSSDWEEVDPKIKRKILGYDDQLMLVQVHFKKGGIGSEHQHHHSQSTLIGSGVFEITVDGVTQKLQKGDSFYVPPNTRHSALCIEEGELIDAFSTMREDFIG